MELDNEWDNFLNNIETTNSKTQLSNDNNICKKETIPECSDIYISTTTKILFLNLNEIDILTHFWKLPVIDYNMQKSGIIKKQIKISLTDKESIDKLDDLLDKENNAKYFIISNIQYNGIVKHIRKVTIGISKKDILSKTNKEKSAFYNCYVIVLRIKFNDIFKEIHIKIFNTGKIEIPGIQTNEMLEVVKKDLIIILKNILPSIEFNNKLSRDILINSNFNCGFYINREELYNILRNKYKINAVYDPCSYPGIRCIYNINNTTKISYMIFRTGSILIVGKCNKEQLLVVYEYIKTILQDEFKSIKSNISQEAINIEKKSKYKKSKKKMIYQSI
tara:strand:+ start:997 stop:1998 length:1002 start_codon:yes stop_codon:yes gene_type:complete